MMNKRCLSGVVLGGVWMFVWQGCGAHVPEKQQLFSALKASCSENSLHGQSCVSFEQVAKDIPGAAKYNTGIANVLKVNGIRAFNEHVVEKSRHLPVVVKVCSDQNEDSKKVIQEFQAVAQTFDGRVCCVALDLFSFHENYHIVSQIMMRENILKLDLPLFLFFKDGALYRTVERPVAILQGFYTRENLEQFITKKFFN